jgi:hypothetical protein
MEPEANPGSNTKPGSNSDPIACSFTDSLFHAVTETYRDACADA